MIAVGSPNPLSKLDASRRRGSSSSMGSQAARAAAATAAWEEEFCSRTSPVERRRRRDDNSIVELSVTAPVPIANSYDFLRRQGRVGADGGTLSRRWKSANQEKSAV